MAELASGGGVSSTREFSDKTVNPKKPKGAPTKSGRLKKYILKPYAKTVLTPSCLPQASQPEQPLAEEVPSTTLAPQTCLP